MGFDVGGGIGFGGTGCGGLGLGVGSGGAGIGFGDGFGLGVTDGGVGFGDGVTGADCGVGPPVGGEDGGTYGGAVGFGDVGAPGNVGIGSPYVPPGPSYRPFGSPVPLPPAFPPDTPLPVLTGPEGKSTVRPPGFFGFELVGILLPFLAALARPDTIRECGGRLVFIPALIDRLCDDLPSVPLGPSVYLRPPGSVTPNE